MKIVIRADASYEIGSGHIMRCLTLAEELRASGAEVSFICRDFKGNLIELIKKNEFGVFVLKGNLPIQDPSFFYKSLSQVWKEDAKETINKILESSKPDLMIIDHYAIDKRWERALRPFVKGIFVIDDLANRPHHCDYLLDQNLFQSANQRYERLLDNKSIAILGPKYALLRKEFIDKRKKNFQKDIKNVLIYFGAADNTGETEKVLSAIIPIAEEYNLEINVLVGYSNINAVRIKELSDSYHFINYVNQTDDIAGLMKWADLSIGAGGSTTWERCCIGLPSIVTAVAENQIRPMMELEKAGAIILMKQSSIVDYQEKLLGCLQMPVDNLQKMIHVGFELFDGHGTKRVSQIINEMSEQNGIA